MKLLPNNQNECGIDVTFIEVILAGICVGCLVVVWKIIEASKGFLLGRSANGGARTTEIMRSREQKENVSDWRNLYTFVKRPHIGSLRTKVGRRSGEPIVYTFEKLGIYVQNAEKKGKLPATRSTTVDL